MERVGIRASSPVVEPTTATGCLGAGAAALRVGRSPDNDLIVRDPATSGHPARIERHGQQFWIVDLGSTNGTLVNGEPIQEKELNHGDRITVGQNAVSFAIVEA